MLSNAKSRFYNGHRLPDVDYHCKHAHKAPEVTPALFYDGPCPSIDNHQGCLQTIPFIKLHSIMRKVKGFLAFFPYSYTGLHVFIQLLLTAEKIGQQDPKQIKEQKRSGHQHHIKDVRRRSKNSRDNKYADYRIPPP